MKIGNGFVTNSSSTSFVITSKNGLTKDKFLKLFGVEEESLLVDFYNNLYRAIHRNKHLIPKGINIRNYFVENKIRIENEEDIKEIERRYLNGDEVFWGSLSDSGVDGGMAEAFISQESFVIIGDDIYFNSRNITF